MNDLFSKIDNTKPVYQGNEILVVESYLGQDICDRWVEFADRKSGVNAPVGAAENDGTVKNQKKLRFCCRSN